MRAIKSLDMDELKVLLKNRSELLDNESAQRLKCKDKIYQELLKEYYNRLGHNYTRQK